MPGRHFPWLAAATLFAAATSVAQPQTLDPAAQDRTTNPTIPAPEPDQATSGAAATTHPAPARTGALQGQDAEFLRRALQSDRLEIASAQAALNNAQRPETREAARMLLEDHQASSQKLQQLASRKGWAMPAGGMNAEADQARMPAAGADFDSRFTAEQVRMHREAIALFREQVAGGSDPDLRQFAKEQLPHLEHHLEMLQGSPSRPSQQ